MGASKPVNQLLSLAGYSPKGCKESDGTEHTHFLRRTKVLPAVRRQQGFISKPCPETWGCLRGPTEGRAGGKNGPSWDAASRPAFTRPCDTLHTHGTLTWEDSRPAVASRVNVWPPSLYTFPQTSCYMVDNVILIAFIHFLRTRLHVSCQSQGNA